MKVHCPDAPACGVVEHRTFNHLVLHRVRQHGEGLEIALAAALPALDAELDRIEAKRLAKAAQKAPRATPVPSGQSSPAPARAVAPPPPVQPFQVRCQDCRGVVGFAPTVEAARRLCGSHIVRTSHSTKVIELAATLPRPPAPAGGTA